MSRSHPFARAFLASTILFLVVSGLQLTWALHAIAHRSEAAEAEPTQLPEAGRIRRKTVVQRHPPAQTAIATTTVAVAQPVQKAGEPRVLSIPSIKLTATVTDVGLLPDGKLDVPDPTKVGWYTLGPKPGEKGKAILDGHLDSSKGSGIFWNLHNVKIDDIISVTDENGAKRDFRVRDMQVYDVRTAPMQTIFGESDDHLLNIITCAGNWDRSLGHYDKRLVVYAQAIDTM